jgi:hypothetical protein
MPRNASISSRSNSASGIAAREAGDATMNGLYQPIELVMEDVSRSPYGRWRNLATGECRFAPPRVGELDWIEVTYASFCPD